MPADTGVYLRFAECSIGDTDQTQAKWPVVNLFFEWTGQNRVWYLCTNPFPQSLSNQWIQLK